MLLQCTSPIVGGSKKKKNKEETGKKFILDRFYFLIRAERSKRMCITHSLLVVSCVVALAWCLAVLSQVVGMVLAFEVVFDGPDLSACQQPPQLSMRRAHSAVCIYEHGVKKNYTLELKEDRRSRKELSV